MGYNNNKTEIVNKWKSSFEKSKSPIFAELVELVVGSSPDYIYGYDSGEEPILLDPKYRKENNELEFISVANMIY